MKKCKITFISHESSLSGAPLLLLNFLKLLKLQNSFDLFIIIKRGGELNGQFSKIAESIVLKPKNYQLSRLFIFKVYDYVFYKIRLFKAIIKAKKSNYIISNTITNGSLLKQFSGNNIPVIVYVHELENVIQAYNKKNNDSDFSLSIAKAFLSPTKIVSKNLIENHSISPEKIFPLNYYLPDIPDIKMLRNKRNNSISFLNKYNIPHNKIYIAGMGTATYRKGIDIFIEACKIVCNANNDIHFVWIGDFLETDFKEVIQQTINQFNIQKYLTITGFLPPSPYNLLSFDLLALTSREDPYPLVALEAALLKIPSIYFSGTGGISDFIGTDVGFPVDNLSAAALSETILSIILNKDLQKNKGELAYQKVLELHCNASLILNQFENVLGYASKN